MPAKKTLDQFLVKAKRIYGDYYDYSKVVYVNSSTKVQIVCPEHGVFHKSPQKFLGAKQGCSECNGRVKWTWNKFVDTATKKYSGKYVYPSQKFATTKDKYSIICPIHGKFSQSISGHLKGGCNQCAYVVRTAKQRDTNEEFIEKAIVKHGRIYDYDKVLYHNSQTKVEITCPTHGDFLMKPNNHLLGQGCPACGRIKADEGIRLSYDKALARFRNIHGNHFEYDESTYIDYTTKMLVTCSIHGFFEVTPHAHVSMQTGCRECGILRTAEKNRYSVEEVLDEFHDIHGNRYKYDSESYIAVDQKIRIKCAKHGWFEQKVSTHKMGSGCQDCSYELIGDRTRVTKEEFIEQSVLEHGNKYDYSKVNWIDQYTEIMIGCYNTEHGFYVQIPRDHKRGSGCPRCNESRGERAVYNWLKENDIEFLPQHTFPDLKNKGLLRCDFYLPEINMVIEYNGVQHYMPIKVFGGEATLIETRYRDDIKKKYCLDNHIHFEIIKYDENVDERLSHLLIN